MSGPEESDEQLRKPGDPAADEEIPDSEAVPEDDRIIGDALRRSLIALAAVALVALVGWWLFGRRHEVVAEVPIPASAPRAVAVRETAPDLPFHDVARAAGIDWRRDNGAEGEKLLPETMGGGVAFLDYDRDGRPDLLLVDGDRWPWSKRPASSAHPRTALYRNLGDGRFRDVSAEAGLDVQLQGQGVAVGDYDDDGWDDVLLTAVGAVRLFHNDHGRFRDVTARAGVGGDPADWNTAAAFFDYDGDGDLDLIIGRYVRWNRAVDFSVDYQLTGVGRAYGPPTNFEATFPILYRNDGDGKFTDVSQQAGVRVTNPATGGPVAKTLGVFPIDVDDDGRPDLFVANDTVANFLLHNRGDGTFEEVGSTSGLAFDRMGSATGAMGVDAGDVRGDGSTGLVVGNFANEMTSAFVSQGPPLLFADEAIPLGLGVPTRTALTFGVLLVDVDLDGRLDLVQANGHLDEDISKVDPSQTYRQSAQLFWNTGSQPTFALVPAPATADLATPIVGRGIAEADWDGDGDPDLVLTQPSGPPLVLRNDQATGHHWLTLELVGDPGRHINSDAIGARVELTVGGRTVVRRISPTRGYLSQSDLPVTFGLGAATRVDRVRVVWPGGAVDEWRDLPVDRRLELAPGAPPR
jgi:hypothetical protein